MSEELKALAATLVDVECKLRALAGKAGRGPMGLALNASATSLWSVRAGLVALAAGGSAGQPCIPPS